MNFDNLIHYELMSGLYRLSRFFRFYYFDIDRIAQFKVQCMKELKIHSVETVSEVSQESNLRTVTYES